MTQGPWAVDAPGPCANADVVPSQGSVTCRDYGKSGRTARRVRLSAPVKVSAGLSANLDDRVFRSLPRHNFLLLLAVPEDWAKIGQRDPRNFEDRVSKFRVFETVSLI